MRIVGWIVREKGIAMEESDRGHIRSAAARADVITFDGHRYRGTSLRTHPPYDRIGSIPASRLREIGTATRASGRRANQPGAESLITVASIEGVSPEIAIAALPRGNVYVREGVTAPSTLTSAPWVQWRMSG